MQNFSINFQNCCIIENLLYNLDMEESIMDEEQKMQEIINRIKDRRKKMMMSYQDLSDKTGLSKSTLQRYETGFIKNIPLDKLEILAYGLDMEPAELMGWNTVKEDKMLSENENRLLQCFKKLTPSGQEKVIDYTEDLSNNRLYVNDSIDDIVMLEHMFTTVASHSDDLTESEKATMDKIILEALKKIK